MSRPAGVAWTTLALAAVIAASGCGGSDGRSGDFAASDLAGLSFTPDELPGLEYQEESSGLNAFARDQEEEADEEGDELGLRFLAQLERLGLEADFVSQLFATGRGSEVGFAESIAFLFEDEGAAEAALEPVMDAAARNISPAEQIAAPDLGTEAFGLRGEFQGFLTYSFGWRVGNVIQLATVGPDDQGAGAESSVELAGRLAATAE